MNFKEIIKQLDAIHMTKVTLACTDNVPGIGAIETVKVIDGKNTPDGIHTVIRLFKDHDVYIMLKAQYTPYNDFHYDYFAPVEEVVPQTEIKYEPVKTLNFFQIRAKLRELQIGVHEFAVLNSFPAHRDLLIKEFGAVTDIEEVIENDFFYVVRYFERHDIYIRLDADVDSSRRLSYINHDLREVKPVQRTVTFYE